MRRRFGLAAGEPDDPQLTVRVDYAGSVCVLTLTGELDMVAARGVMAQVMDAVHALVQAGPAAAERVVLDLSGLAFLDCAGARALALAARAVPEHCPVIVRAISPAAARLLDLAGISLEHGPTAAGGLDWARELRHRSQLARFSARQAMGHLIDVAEVVAATEERVAAIMVWMAAQRPDRADSLIDRSEQALRYAAANRRWAAASSAWLEERAT